MCQRDTRSRRGRCSDMSLRIPITIFGVVLLGIWTPGTEIDRGIPADSPNRSMGAISRYDEKMDQLRLEQQNRPEKEY
ncbi:unnamed protein product [Durusdinium trenchii]|uniref:Uncharacterized protein n=1 Tax=Durusdinium trenchii TaxID=1381693 RepID=A0ABP0QUB9_9DINO